MELASIKHITADQLSDIQADIFITSLSHESRSIHVAGLLEDLQCRKVALSRANPNKEYAYRDNLAYFLEKDFEILPQKNELPDMANIMKAHQEKEVSIVVDCTSMHRPWYYEMFRWLVEKQEIYDRAHVRFAYTMADFVAEKSTPKLKRLEEFIRFDSRKKKSQDALIMGLGQEPNISDTIFNQIRPDLLYLFYSDPAADKRFVKELLVNNHGMINSTHIRNLIAYPIDNGHTIYQSLINTILPLRNECRITLVPQGPKIFSLACLLVKLSYPDIRIRYPRFKKDLVFDRKAAGAPVILDIFFEREE
jgi:hypothetical protein